MKHLNKAARFFIVCLSAALTSCAYFQPPPGIGKPVTWAQVDGWESDTHADAWPALLQSCAALDTQADEEATVWTAICRAAREVNDDGDGDGDSNSDSDNDNDDASDGDIDSDNKITDQRAREFFEQWFTPHKLHGKAGASHGLITGYYEPLLFGSKTQDDRFQYPLYGAPENLLSIKLADIFPELKNKRVRGRLDGNTVLPFYSRSEIDSDPSLLAGNELLWVDDRDSVFFLHIQGSGRVQLPDGETVGVGYANQNGHPYYSIGRVLLNEKELEREDISLFTIRQWLRDNPARAEELLFNNPSYVFFSLREQTDGAIGSLRVPLTPERSLAIDPTVVELGVPIWLSTNFPGDEEQPYQRLVFAQDTGGAIKGALRADLFWGHGDYAERAAGVMRERARLIVLLPNVLSETDLAHLE